MLKEFRDFAMRGSVIDLAVGVIIGAAFGKIITSFVNDVLMPPIGLLLGNVDFSELFIALNRQTYASLAEAQAAGAPTLNYGLFINTVIDFLLVALVIFMLIRTINRLHKPAPAESITRECPYCFSVIPVRATRCPNCTSELKRTGD
jgi:large conductance mechanosensitive channel